MTSYILQILISMSFITVYMSIIVYCISNMTHDNENVKWITYAHEKGNCTFSEE